MKNVEGFIVQKGYAGKEEMAIAIYCTMNNLKFQKVQYSKKKSIEIPLNYIPCGSIPWMYSVIGQEVKPDYYPDFLKDYLNREVWKTDKWPLNKRVFIKPSDKHKRFTGFVTYGTYKKKKKGPYWCSDVVAFDNEWRYYIAYGKVIAAEWYAGDEIETPDAPSIDHIEFPQNYFAAVDFGICDGELTLVEAHQPFACGWYGKEHHKYVEWLAEGWINRNEWTK